MIGFRKGHVEFGTIAEFGMDAGLDLEDAADAGSVSEITSNRWGVIRACCIAAGSCKSEFAKSAMVLVHAEKFGCDKIQPIGFANGISIRSGFFGPGGNRTTN